MGNVVEIDIEGLRSFVANLRSAADGGLKREFESFLEGLGTEFLRVVEDEIVRKKVMDSRLLLASFHQGDSENIWEIGDGGMYLEVGTNVEYASYVNDGHWLNPQGVEKRFVPGTWSGDRFIYDHNAKTGMVLKQKWVEGAHFWKSAITIFERIMPEMLDRKIEEWFENYFS